MFFLSTYKNRNRTLNRPQKNNKTRKMLRKPKIIIGKVYATWCGHCVELTKIWPQVIKGVKSSSPLKNSVRFVSIEEKGLDNKLKHFYKKYHISENEKIKVNGYPTIFKIKDGSITYFDGERNVESIKNWIIKP